MFDRLAEDDDGAWISALDLAAETGTPFWCDDVVLRSLADERALPAFGTVDLVRQLRADERLSSEVADTIEATLIANYHVELGFSPNAMRFAAELDGWRPGGAAFALSRLGAWGAPDEAFAFLIEALVHQADRDPEDLRTWVAHASFGLVRGISSTQATHNLKILLNSLMQQPWMRPDRLPAVLAGARAGLSEQPESLDPLEDVLRDAHAQLVKHHNHATASLLVINLTQHLGEADRQVAARVILA